MKEESPTGLRLSRPSDWTEEVIQAFREAGELDESGETTDQMAHVTFVNLKTTGSLEVVVFEETIRFLHRSTDINKTNVWFEFPRECLGDLIQVLQQAEQVTD